MNAGQRRRCRSSKRHFDTHRAATWRMHQIGEAPTLTPDGNVRLYMPSHVVTCHCGGYVLTSKSGKQYAKGKQTKGRNHR